MRELRHIRWLALLVILVGCRLNPPVCDSEVHIWGTSDGAYHLPHDALSPVVHNSTGYTPDLEAWNTDTPLTLRGSGSGFPIHVVEAGNADSSWLGLASIRIGSENHITSGKVSMNRALLSPYPPAVAEHVLCQELGHILGLTHHHALDSCMDDCQGRGSGWLACLSSEHGKTPNAHDAEQLREIYEHALDGKGDPPAPRCQGSITLDIFEGEVL